VPKISGGLGYQVDCNACDRIAGACRRAELTSFAIVPVRIIRSPDLAILAAILVGGALATATTPALAEMHVRGSPEAVRVEARDSSVAEILSGLSSAFNMHYQSSANLDKRMSGIYAGPLSRVLTRILDGYNFVVKTDNGSIAVTVFAPANTGAAPAASSAVRVVRQPAEGGALQARTSAKDAARPPVSASVAAPSPTLEGVQTPTFPTPTRPSAGAAPAPVAEPRESEAAAPAPPVAGSKPSSAPEPGRPADTPAPPAAPLPPAK
jgi:hypothetical protein